MRLAHDHMLLKGIRIPTAEEPLRVLVSGCIAGLPCGTDGTDYGLSQAKLTSLFQLPQVQILAFCPEDHGIGARAMVDRACSAQVELALDHHQHPWTRDYFGF